MNMKRILWKVAVLYFLSLITFVAIPLAQQKTDQPSQKVSGGGDLQSKLQNPVGSIYSVPIEATFDFGAANGDAVFINLQPVIPINFGKWNLINRTILPLIDAPGAIAGRPGNPDPVPGDKVFGLGDINHSVFLSPAQPGKLIWGVGPIVTFPTASDDAIGSGKWSAGPTAVFLTQPKPWSLGLLIANIWSFAGDSDRGDVNQLIFQPFVNYNLQSGWYLTSSPIWTSNWNADSSERWTIGLGGGFGKLFKIGNQPINAKVQAFYNVEKPTLAPDWSTVFTLQFVFPKK